MGMDEYIKLEFITPQKVKGDGHVFFETRQNTSKLF